MRDLELRRSSGFAVVIIEPELRPRIGLAVIIVSAPLLNVAGMSGGRRANRRGALGSFKIKAAGPTPKSRRSSPVWTGGSSLTVHPCVP